MTANNLSIWKLIITLQAMADEGYSFVDVTIEDDFVVKLKAKKIADEDKSDDKPDINQLII